MNKDEIIFDWLSKEDNRQKLDKLTMDECNLETFEAYGEVYSFGNQTVATIGKKYYLIIKKTNEANRNPTRKQDNY